MDKVILLLAVVAGAARSEFYDDFVIPSYTRTSLGDSVDIASMKLLKEAYNGAVDKNVVASPLGVLTLLSLYASGVGNENREEIVRYLGVSDYRQLQDSYIQLCERFVSMDHSFLTLANKVYVSDKLALQDKFLTTARYYRSEVDNINFEDTAAAADAINQWSANNTAGKIAHPVSESDIIPNAAVALLNVIFFQGHWNVPFNASETKDKEFHLDRSTSVKKPMMHLQQSLHYYASPALEAQMVELPYKESKFRMVVIVPNEIDGLQGVIDKVAEKGLLEDVFNLNPYDAEMEFSMPKFEIKSKLDLNDLLPKVGVSRIFNEPALGIVKDQGVAVASAFQQAFVKVDEEGATAGAFTGLLLRPVSSFIPIPKPIKIKVDHPFLFAILHDDVILFAGTYAH